jgi:hypothetical protein
MTETDVPVRSVAMPPAEGSGSGSAEDDTLEAASGPAGAVAGAGRGARIGGAAMAVPCTTMPGSAVVCAKAAAVDKAQALVAVSAATAIRRRNGDETIWDKALLP